MNEDIYELIRSGKYKNQVPYPGSLKKPNILRDSLSGLTQEELSSIRKIKDRFEKEQEAHIDKMHSYNEGESDAVALFWDDVCTDYGVDREDPFVVEMKRLAWQEGYGNGLSEVLIHFDELMELYRLKEKSCQKAKRQKKKT